MKPPTTTGFWDQYQQPVIGLSPMDGVTDAAYRYIVDQYGKPDLLVTEFIPVEGITRGAVKLLLAFIHHQTTTPTVAQIYGVEVPAFYTAAMIVAELGFDGVDINMGCPAKNVSRRGAGAGLIQTPETAKEIVRQTQQGVADWAAGRSLEDAGVVPKMIAAIKQVRERSGASVVERRLIPVTVKTRTGYDHPVTRDWINHLAEVEPVTIGLHGRTLKQMYTGEADWEQIGIAAEALRGSNIRIIGNGDISSLSQAHERIRAYGLDGVLIGRASFGNPWIFCQDELPGIQDRFQAAIAHGEAFENLTPELNFLSLRKHMGWYCKGFANASSFRGQLMQVSTAQEIRQLLTQEAYRYETDVSPVPAHTLSS